MTLENQLNNVHVLNSPYSINEVIIEGRRRLKISEHILKDKNFPARFFNAKRSDLTPEIIEHITPYLDLVEDDEEQDRGLILHSFIRDLLDNTFALMMISILARFKEVFLISTFDLEKFIKQNPTMNEYEAYQFLIEVNTLGIYDMGLEVSSPSFQDALARILRGRYLAMNRTVISCVMTNEQRRRKYDYNYDINEYLDKSDYFYYYELGPKLND